MKIAELLVQDFDMPVIQMGGYTPRDHICGSAVAA